ncbi:hypothetical protein OAK91_07135, partial [Planctomycetaceae bacterium]|nr:hypothetical protein [Planctomycetaceae bacterium]
QAVGRVMRRPKDGSAKTGTIVIPVFIDESEDAEKSLSKSAFDPVWQVLRALRAHDQELADWLDNMRTNMGRIKEGKAKSELPNNVYLDFRKNVRLANFEETLSLRLITKTTDKQELTVSQILSWADEHHKRTGKWPKHNSGKVHEQDETWNAIDFSLKTGGRGLKEQLSLAKLLWERRGVKWRRRKRSLNLDWIQEQAIHYYYMTGKWPTNTSGEIFDTGENWMNIQIALQTGDHGLKGGQSLEQLLYEFSTTLNDTDKAKIPKKDLALGFIYSKIYEYRNLTGKWPKSNAPVDSDQNLRWGRLYYQLKIGFEGLPRGINLNALIDAIKIDKHDKFTPHKLTKAWIKKQSQIFYSVNHEFPNPRKTGYLRYIGRTNLSWESIDLALKFGLRGLNGGSSLVSLFVTKYSKTNRKNSQKDIDEKPPTTHSKNTSFKSSNQSSKTNSSGLTYGWIAIQASEYYSEHGKWPNAYSGKIDGSDTTWASIDAALRIGLKGFPGGESLDRLIKPLSLVKGSPSKTQKKSRPKQSELHGVRSTSIQKKQSHTNLNEEWIIHKALEHRKVKGFLPDQKSGIVLGTNEFWYGIHYALLNKKRGLSAGLTLEKFLKYTIPEDP